MEVHHWQGHRYWVRGESNPPRGLWMIQLVSVTVLSIQQSPGPSGPMLHHTQRAAGN